VWRGGPDRETLALHRTAPNLGDPVAEVTLSQTPAGSNNRVFGYIGLGIAALLLVGVTAVFFWPRGGSTSKPGRVEAEPARMGACTKSPWARRSGLPGALCSVGGT
jgi:hypothetical protein